jgi:DNA-binding MarR family transcriptional regulator
MTRSPDRPDLAAMIGPLGRALVQAELPVLRAHGLTMWAYVVLLALEESPVRTQSALAAAIGADKTRIIGTLDDLQERGLISRSPDPSDRRVRVLALTPSGRALRDSAQAAIQSNEERVLRTHLSPSDRRTFLRALAVLSALPESEIAGGSG